MLFEHWQKKTIGCSISGIAIFMSSVHFSWISAIVLASLFPADWVWSGSASLQPGPSPVLVWISPGSFFMGSLPGEKDRLRQEGPRLRVTFSQGFWMGKFEVTQAEYQAVMGRNPSRFPGDLRRPVEQVSCPEAIRFCARLTERERQAGRLPPGHVFRLPTEAEWEYAARAGTDARFSFGDDLAYATLGRHAWFNQNSGGGTHPVGSLCPNPWGLCDMYGNVEEWCGDGWRASLAGMAATDPKTPPTGKFRVIRGGSWRAPASQCRSASRDYAWPDYHEKGTTGFRVVLAREPFCEQPSHPKP